MEYNLYLSRRHPFLKGTKYYLFHLDSVKRDLNVWWAVTPSQCASTRITLLMVLCYLSTGIMLDPAGKEAKKAMWEEQSS